MTKYFKQLIIISLIMFSAYHLYARPSNNIDSLKIAVENMKDDSLKITVFYKISVGLYKTNPNEMHVYAETALKLT